MILSLKGLQEQKNFQDEPAKKVKHVDRKWIGKFSKNSPKD